MHFLEMPFLQKQCILKKNRVGYMLSLHHMMQFKCRAKVICIFHFHMKQLGQTFNMKNKTTGPIVTSQHNKQQKKVTTSLNILFIVFEITYQQCK